MLFLKSCQSCNSVNRKKRIFAACLLISVLKAVTTMPKVKTNSAAKKRFKLTGTGKIKRKHAFHSHILTKKTTKQKRNLVHDTTVNKSDENRIKALLNV